VAFALEAGDQAVDHELDAAVRGRRNGRPRRGDHGDRHPGSQPVARAAARRGPAYRGRVPDPPWLLRGECILAWVAQGRRRQALPPGLVALPGRAALVGVHYDDSPFGPYDELSLAVPARLGLRPGLCVVAMAVTSPDARRACRTNLGLPAELGSLRWSAHGVDRSMAWDERGVLLRGVPWGPSVPAMVPVRSVQRGSDGPVIVPRRFSARMRLAACHAEVPADDALAWVTGRHPGAVMAGMRIAAHPARRPAGLLSSIARPQPRRTAGEAGGAATMSERGRMAQLVRAQPSHG
jgi:hypothetical protein